MAASNSIMTQQVTDAQHQRFARLIYDRTGIRILPQKKTLLSNRIRRRLKATGVQGFDAYFNHLRKLEANAPEWDGFLQEITTHETYLFRDKMQWKWLRESFFPEISAAARRGHRKQTLNIWSAACSTGDEVYTIAACIAASLVNFNNWQIKILGTDIGIGALEEARSAVFGQRAMKLVPEKLCHRFFCKHKNLNLWEAKPILTQMTTFRQYNLLDPFRGGPFDLVFLKNVLIYFDVKSKQKVLKNVRAAMKAGGILVSGPAEGVSDLLHDLVKINPWLYRKHDHPKRATK